MRKGHEKVSRLLNPQPLLKMFSQRRTSSPGAAWALLRFFSLADVVSGLLNEGLNHCVLTFCVHTLLLGTISSNIWISCHWTISRCYTVKCHIWPVSCGDAVVLVHALRPVNKVTDWFSSCLFIASNTNMVSEVGTKFWTWPWTAFPYPRACRCPGMYKKNGIISEQNSRTMS